MYTETLPLCINIYSTKVEIETLQIEFSVEYNVLKNKFFQLKKNEKFGVIFSKPTLIQTQEVLTSSLHFI